MFNSKKIKETEDALQAAQTSLSNTKQALDTATASLQQKEQESRELSSTLQKQQTELQACQSVNAELLTKYGALIDADKLLEEKKRTTQELNDKYNKAIGIYEELEKQVTLYEEQLDIGSFGLYKPQFDFDTSEKFKRAIDANYEKQKALVKEEKAIVSHTEWTVAGSKTEGKKMTTQYKKLMLFAFNGECEGLIARVKWNNAEKTKERITKAFESINKLGASHTIEITREFLELKWEELALTYENEQKKYEEKEEQRRIREQMREEEKAQREFERAQREAEDEEERYQRALEKAQRDLNGADRANTELLNEKIKLLEQQLQEAHAKKERAVAMAQLTRVGHIYVISNIGSFGEDVYKLGMTRRLDPLDRVRELGDASVPFHFDVHAIIYSEDAPQLENQLHQQFSDRRINRINTKKEFFRVTLDEIEAFVNQHTGAQIQFTKMAEARDYRETLSLLDKLKQRETTSTQQPRFPLSILDN